jgi:hypothetical protein
MLNFKKIYRKNIYGIMGTLIFHIALFSVFLGVEFKIKNKIENNEAVLVEISTLDESRQELKPESITTQKNDLSENKGIHNEQNNGSNRAVNDAALKDKFFDESYRREVEDAKNLVADVNKQLSKKIIPTKKFEMPEATSEGEYPDSVKNVIYSGKSNIHYFLENRFHLRLPIPVYLARGGGTITVDIQVNRTGNVIKAEARPANNIHDEMLPVYATQAAERTQFNSDSKAPMVQKGTITYKFVAQ